MENNFYVGNIYHRRKLRNSFIEKAVLYSNDSFYYLDLINERWYTTDTTKKDYVIKDSLVFTDIDSHYSTDYLYLLERNKIKKKIKK